MSKPPNHQTTKPLSQNAISLRNLSKKYYLQEQRTFKELLPALFKGGKGGRFIWALKDINLDVKKGEIVGIVGKNGSGKSTLLKLIAGVTEPTRGELEVEGKVSPLIELGAGFHPELTGKENIYLNASILGISKKIIDQKYKKIVDFAQLSDFINNPVKHYSSGMYMRLGFSIAVNVDPDILLVDEILAVGDIGFRKKCIAKMNEFRRTGVTIVFVSHSLPTVISFCQKAIWLENGKISASGNTNDVVSRYSQKVEQDK